MVDDHSYGTGYVDVEGDDYYMEFKFEFVKQTDGTIRTYIINQPDYASGQNTDGHSTHRYGINDRPYICFEPDPTHLEDAKEIAREWARRTAHYIKHNEWINS